MGGHGGLNILPQKKWNVYRRDNQEKVIRDKEILEQSEFKKRNDESDKTIKSAVSLLYGDRSLHEPKSKAKNINLFEMEEKNIQEHFDEHQKYLKSVGHSDKDNAPFVACSVKPWWASEEIHSSKNISYSRNSKPTDIDSTPKYSETLSKCYNPPLEKCNEKITNKRERSRSRSSQKRNQDRETHDKKSKKSKVSDRETKRNEKIIYVSVDDYV